MNFQRLNRFLLLLALVAGMSPAQAGSDATWADLMTRGLAHRQQGNIVLAIDSLAQAHQAAKSEGERARAAGELGASLLQARRLDQAKTRLGEAHAFFSGPERARYANDLGNLAVIARRKDEARAFYEEAMLLAGNDTSLSISAGLNIARQAGAAEKLAKLASIYPQIAMIENTSERARLYLNLGTQALALGKPGIAISYQSLDLARQLTARQPSDRLRVETLDSLAQLYEEQDKIEDSLRLTRQALDAAVGLAPGSIGDLLVSLEWRQGRLYRRIKQDGLALPAYQRAVQRIEAIRQDIPIDYDDGRSSFRHTLEPVYLGYAELLLQESGHQPGAGRSAYLRRAVDTIELIKQAELQDFLGDRCNVESIKGGTATPVPPATGVLYPLILSDRIELLMETTTGIFRLSTPTVGVDVRRAAIALASSLRNGDEGYMRRSRQFYDWLLRPFEALIAEQSITTLVIVPDGALRLVAMGALHDGKQFAIEKFAISTVTGLSMTNITPPPMQDVVSLIAGVSDFRVVAEKLSKAGAKQILAAATSNPGSPGLAQSRTLRSARNVGSNITDKSDSVSHAQALAAALALPGVNDEIQAIGKIMPGMILHNSTFTLDGFRQEAEGGSYRIVHVASHGMFGGSAETSFILAYDGLLTLDSLQSLLKGDQFLKNPIELLSLSACETAEGDDRSPLGISGAAMKARAKSVLGTLWPVEDNAARNIMEKFYGRLINSRLSKSEALRLAQLDLIRSPEFSHPFFWAPFVLIGNWL